MRIHHIAIWTFRLEELRDFYIRYFNGRSNGKYTNPKTGFESYFIHFDDGAAIELMRRADIQGTPAEADRTGLTHLALAFPGEQDVLRITEQLRSNGHIIAGEPRTSGDGYFESVILDPDGNRVECVYRKEETPSAPEAPLETERLLLRPFRESDAEALYLCCRNPNLGNNAGWKPHESPEESRGILHSVFMSQPGVWAVILKEEKRLIGSVGIVADPKRDNPQARMLGYWLDEPYWGKGYMSEAVKAVISYGFGTLRLTLLTANCYPHNERSIQLLKRHGFVYEGTLQQAELTCDGHLYDHQCYRLNRD